MKTLHKTKAMAIGIALTALGITSLVSCKKEKAEEANAKLAAIVPGIKPQEFPSNLNIPGFNFPEDSTAIYGWLNKADTASIARHAWGLWAGITQKSNQVYNGDSLMVFETWMGVKELAKMAADGNKQGGCDQIKKQRTPLNVPKQFVHGMLFANKKAVIDSTKFKVFETVAYNPAAACFATENLIFNQSVLNQYQVKDGIGKIPDFPAAAITTKPTYYAGKPDNNGFIKVPVWPGTPNPAKVYGYNDWQTFVYADINNKQSNTNITPVTTANPTPAQIKAASCNLSDFLYMKIDQKTAAYLNEHQNKKEDQFKAGDYVLLMAMHVGTKEISNWTWQTYFWSYNPETPFAPSSTFLAKLRPKQIKGAAANYAVSTSYTMVWPNQPITGGTDKGVKPMISFNPYLEGSFGPGTFNIPNNYNKTYQYGVQTNCMTCHALATQIGVGYATDQYIDMKDMKLFKNQVQLDFAWSIQSNINKTK